MFHPDELGQEMHNRLMKVLDHAIIGHREMEHDIRELSGFPALKAAEEDRRNLLRLRNFQRF
jgi:hypothetical protein